MTQKPLAPIPPMTLRVVSTAPVLAADFKVGHCASPGWPLRMVK
jgi:hypothetical protein